MRKKIKFLEKMYLLILLSIFLLIVFTPYIIKSGFTVFDEQLVEGTAIILLFAVGYAVLFLYQKEVSRNFTELNRLRLNKETIENQLAEAFKYIGNVNIQLEEIESVFSDLQKFPENKKDIGQILQFLAKRTLNMVNAEWVLFRIIDTRSLDTLGEYSEMRGDTVSHKHRISNRVLASNGRLEKLTVVGSKQENSQIRTFCIIPKEKISRDVELFIKAVVNQLEMLFLIFSFIYYKDCHGNNEYLSTR
ncbi:hypothetical protein ACFL1Z_03730 [Thermodesulfobacteriota bacterium]